MSHSDSIARRAYGWIRVALNRPTEGKVRLTLRIKPDAHEFVNRLAREAGVSCGEVLRLALALYKIAHEEKQKGNVLGFHSDPNIFDKRIVGIP